jgi:hypothetical protein
VISYFLRFRFLVTVPLPQFSYLQVLDHSVSFPLYWNGGLAIDAGSFLPPALLAWVNNAPAGVVQPICQAPPGVVYGPPAFILQLFQNGVAVINALPDNISTNFATLRAGGAEVLFDLSHCLGMS